MRYDRACFLIAKGRPALKCLCVQLSPVAFAYVMEASIFPAAPRLSSDLSVCEIDRV